MIYQLNKSNILFLDIETVSAYPDYSQLSDKRKELWEKKMKYSIENEKLEASELYNRAGIYAEFGKIICISVGLFYSKAGKTKFRIKSFFGDDEKALIQGFNDLLNQKYNSTEHYLCGHNGKEFDFPYISRRMVINQIKIPKKINQSGKKPRETSFLDTMEMRKF